MTYKSNIKVTFEGLDLKLQNAINSGELQRTVATYLLASNNRRVFNDGKSVAGGRIGSYSTSPPIYINPKNSPKKFQTKGKHGESKFRNGRLHRTKWFASYKAFRSGIGRESSFVNLQLSGKLKLDFALEANGKNYIIGFRSHYGDVVSRGNEHRFGKRIWGVTKEDNDVIYGKIIPEFLNKIKK